ncbi:MAG: hypothetical protein KF812_00870 [Fimbriimonadaceae bacterium]|nr:hypothetical protein [Fimbriimonadaceae bacterium]
MTHDSRVLPATSARPVRYLPLVLMAMTPESGSPPAPATAHAAIVAPQYELKRQIMQLVGRNFRVYDSNAQLVLFCHQKGFKLKEDLRVYRDEAKTQEVMAIGARKIIDFSGAYDVTDSVTGEKIGVLRRMGMKSIIRDEWIVMDANEQVIGKVIEDNMVLALLRRFANLIPQNYDLLMNDGSRAVDFRGNWNPFAYRLVVDFADDPQGRMDRRLAFAMAFLLAAIEGRQGG